MNSYRVKVGYRPNPHVPRYEETWLETLAWNASDAAAQIEIEHRDLMGGLRILKVEPRLPDDVNDDR